MKWRVSKINSLLDSKIEYLQSFVDSTKKQLEVMPEVQKSLDYYIIERRMFQFNPEKIANNDLKMIESHEKLDFRNIKSIVPRTQAVSFSLFQNLTCTASGTNAYMTILSNMPITQDDDFGTKIELVSTYEKLKISNGFENEIEIELGKIDISLADDFRKLKEAYYSNMIEPAALYMRTILEHLKGRLWVLVKKNKENSCSINIIFERLAKAEKGTTAFDLLMDQVTVFERLHDLLSSTMKGNTTKIPNGVSINMLYNMFIDHLQYILKSISIKTCNQI
jgi:hypothetical protein